MSMKRAQQGFTLIELMIVVAIIGILAAVAIPSYQSYTAKSKFTAAQAEIAAGKTTVDAYLNENSSGTISTPSDMGLKALTANCETAISIDSSTGIGDITCTVKGGPAAVAGKDIVLSRASDGSWSCGASTIDDSVKSKSCQ